MAHYSDSILVVDDSADDRFIIERAFMRVGVTGCIHYAVNALQAISYLKGEGGFGDRSVHRYPSFILTDLDMPGGDGFDLLAFLQGCEPQRRAPVVVLSATTAVHYVQRARALGACAYHRKADTYADMCRQIEVLHAYWGSCLFAEATEAGDYPGIPDGRISDFENQGTETWCNVHTASKPSPYDGRM